LIGIGSLGGTLRNYGTDYNLFSGLHMAIGLPLGTLFAFLQTRYDAGNVPRRPITLL